MLKLVMVCGACPEAYDAFDGDEMVGYLRLRHGRFSVECPDVGGQLIYVASPEGDGIFTYDERDYYLKEAVKAIQYWRNGEPSDDDEDDEYVVVPEE